MLFWDFSEVKFFFFPKLEFNFAFDADYLYLLDSDLWNRRACCKFYISVFKDHFFNEAFFIKADVGIIF